MSNFKELVRLGRDAEVRYTSNGKSVTGFSAAFDNGWGERKQTVWLDCSFWGERGEKVSTYLTKGSQVVVEGDIGTREHDGKTYVTLDVREVKLTGKGGDKPQRQESRPQKAAGGAKGQTEMDDDIPFAPHNRRCHY